MKKIIILLITLIVLGFASCYVWINMGLSQAINEKTLNITYEDLMNNEHIQSLDFEMQKAYEGGSFFDKYTEYETTKFNNSIEEKIVIRVDNSTKEVETISIYFDVDEQENILSAQITASLYATFFSSALDKDITEEARADITHMIMNMNEYGNMDSFTFHDIEYSVGLINSYAFVIAAKK